GANSPAPVPPRRHPRDRGRCEGAPEAYPVRTGYRQICCLAAKLNGFSYLFLLVADPTLPFLKSAQCRFESDWGHSIGAGRRGIGAIGSAPGPLRRGVRAAGGGAERGATAGSG